MTFNRFEIIGGILSVACMVLALWLIRVETVVVAENLDTNTQSAAVRVAGEDEAALRSAFDEAVDENGSLGRMIIDDVVTGAGEAVKEGDTITVHYKGMLQNGQEFDNSYNRGEPISFKVGAGRVITGWEEGVLGMQVGGERILVIPPALAYGTKGYGPIPGGATLVFMIELLSIE